MTKSPRRDASTQDVGGANRGSGWVANAAIITATLAGLVAVTRRSILFGSRPGKHFYTYIAPLTAETVAIAILGIPVVLIASELARRYVDARPRSVLGMTVVV